MAVLTVSRMLVNRNHLLRHFIFVKLFQVTADGSIDCQQDPGEQESLVSSLHVCETVSGDSRWQY
jgi:hypothetical protein